MFIFACGGQSGVQFLFAEQSKSVRAYAPEMNNMEMAATRLAIPFQKVVFFL